MATAQAIKHPEKFEKGFRVSKEKLKSALSEALKKIDGNLADFRTKFPANRQQNEGILVKNKSLSFHREALVLGFCCAVSVL